MHKQSLESYYCLTSSPTAFKIMTQNQHQVVRLVPRVFVYSFEKDASGSPFCVFHVVPLAAMHVFAQ